MTLLAAADPATARGRGWWVANYDMILGLKIALRCAAVVAGFIYLAGKRRKKITYNQEKKS